MQGCPGLRGSRAAGSLCSSRPQVLPSHPSRSSGRHVAVSVSKDTASPQELALTTEDPEKIYRTIGPKFGQRYKLEDSATWVSEAPRVKVHSVEDRKLDELLELAVLNERLNPGGMPSWEARRRLDYLKLRRRNWEAIYHYITETDAVATLALIEEANAKVEEALSEDATQRTSVGSLQKKLLALQENVDAAAQRLNSTQKRVEQNLARVNELKVEAAALERMRIATPPETETLVETVSRATPLSRGITAFQAEPAPAPVRKEKNAPKKDRGLHSSLEMEDRLREFWFPVNFSNTLVKDMMVPVDLFGQSWVLFRDENGAAACIKDTCAHRACPLSLGSVTDGQVSCAYHGWRFNADGLCTEMPSTAFCRNVAVAALPCAERDNFVWVWPGDGPPPEVPSFTAPPAGFQVHAEICVEVPVEHGLLVENLLDLAHAPFTHTSTFARGWPIPDYVKFKASQMLSGNWDPYPISMSFQPPCVTVSNIGLAQPGQIMRGVRAEECTKHLHQLHVCMPAKKGHTRLLYRMSMDFMGWIRHVPFIQMVWKQVAAQVLGEDLVLVTGQQDRMQKGDDTWGNPMAYDKLAVRYRRWRNTVAAGDTKQSEELAVAASMNAGELFAEGEEDEGCPVFEDEDEVPTARSRAKAIASRAAGVATHV
mmetsp:Transcript_7065/g.12060  ORF Transcript_7065/g.12060 Transcript_7065/m.12060 type:complete len:654 (-) Transcript_7065:1149-3110(-)